MTRYRLGTIVMTLVMLFGMAASALAQDAGAKSLGTFKAWTAWQGTDANGMICYISAQPSASELTTLSKRRS